MTIDLAIAIRDGSEISKSQFDELIHNNMIVEPMIESFGDGYGEPYNPDRRAYGRSKDGKIYWAWVRGKNIKS